MLKKVMPLALVLILVVGILSLSGCGGEDGTTPDTSSSTKTVTLRMASDAPVTHTLIDSHNRKACEMVFEKTDGRVKIDYYPASQLGSYEIVYEELMGGTIDIAQIPIPETYDARTSMQVVPYYARSYEELKILYGEGSYMVEMMQELLADKGIRYMGFTCQGFDVYGATKPAQKPFAPNVDKGLKMRSSPFEITRKLVQGMGYEPVIVAWSETPSALQTGIVDAWAGGTIMHNYSLVSDIIDYLYVTNAQAEAEPYLISEKSLARLSKEDQQIVFDVFGSVSKEIMEKAESFQNEFLQKLIDEHGVKVEIATPEEEAAIARYVRENVWPEYENILTKEVLDGMKAELKKHGLE